MLERFNNLFKSNDRRTANLNFQLFVSLIIKGASFFLNYLQVPVSIVFLGNERYGFWLTLLSVGNWISMFDLGLGHGLKNKIAESISNEDTLLAQKYSSTGYFIIGAVTLLLSIIFTLLFPYINFNNILNQIPFEGFSLTVYLTIITFFASFFLNLVNSLLSATQNTSMISVSSLISNLLIFTSLVILNYLGINKVFYIGLIYSLSMFLGSIYINISFFKKYRYLIPSIKKVDFQKIKEIIGIGSKFFIIQINIVVIYFCDNLVISHFLGNKQVVLYNIVLKIYNIVIIIVSILSISSWSFYTEAYNKKDLTWILNTIKKFNIILLPILIFIIIISFFLEDIIRIWIGQNMDIPVVLILTMACYHVIYAWNYNYSVFLYSISAINIQLPYIIISGLLNIPLAIFFIKVCGLGVEAVTLSSLICMIPFSFLGPYWTRKKLSDLDEKIN